MPTGPQLIKSRLSVEGGCPATHEPQDKPLFILFISRTHQPHLSAISQPLPSIRLSVKHYSPLFHRNFDTVTSNLQASIQVSTTPAKESCWRASTFIATAGIWSNWSTRSINPSGAHQISHKLQRPPTILCAHSTKLFINHPYGSPA